ncbi:hypothetical protein [Bdellovibrio sp. HCB337]|uniref:hypothetical protein n=1 Tax=Bdellovibrio sp. HCB337 TaxID=3394358 RepID=UPI0039A46345
MKKLALMLSMIPLIALAYETSSESPLQGIPLSDEELSDVVETTTSRCRKSSDMFCYGKNVGAVCVTDPQPPYGRSGICQQWGRGDRRGDVTCLCR